ncbi:MAG: hypothetical protein ACRDTR_21765, partial [Rubrobacter sp.]
MGFGGEEPRRSGRPETTSGGRASDRTRRDGRRRPSPLLALLAVLILALLAMAAILLWRSLGDSIPGTSVTSDSIDSGPEPRVHLINAAGRVRVDGVEGLESVQYEATKYATAADPAAAKREASEVPVDISREGSTVSIETDGGRQTGADYTLEVPASAAVEIESEAGDVEVLGFSGNVMVMAEAGDVTVGDLGGDVTVEAPQGDVSVSRVSTDTG